MNCRVIAIGASTGGVNAIMTILASLPSNLPPILIVQHMPPRFTAIFAQSIKTRSAMAVKEAENGDMLTQGSVFIAPAGKHMQLQLRNNELYVEVFDGNKIYYQKPSIDVLFRSVAKHVGKEAIGIILTGMGKDGATGLLEMKQSGAYTIAQDEKTSVIYGMPKEAVFLGAALKTLPLTDIAPEILFALKKSW